MGNIIALGNYLKILEQLDMDHPGYHAGLARLLRRQGDFPGARKILEDYLNFTLAAGYQFVASNSCYQSEGKPSIHIIDIDAPDISSTEIRHNVKKNNTIEHLVPAKVAEFIQSKGLYR